VAAAAALGAAVLNCGGASAQDDAYLWLEERTGPRALEWAKSESGRAHREITGDLRFRSYLDKTLSMFVGDGTVESGSVMGDHYYSFQQDAQNPIGRWQRTTFESYASNAPRWEMLIDFDSLAKRDGVNWVFSYAWCEEPEYRFCSVSMSPDGGDAIAIREFDTQSREFVATGFNVPPSKSDYTYIDTDTVLLSSALAPDELTASGYARVVKLWKRGTPLEAAETVYEIAHGDMGLTTFELADPEFDRDYLLIQRDIDFYTREWLVYTPDGALRTIPMPSNMERWIQFEGQFIMNPMGDWTAPNGQVLKAGGLYAFEFRDWVDTGEVGTYTELMAPRDRFSIAELWNTRSRLLVTAYENVQGRVYALDRQGDAWSEPTRLRLPANGVVTVVQADPFGADVIVAYENMVTPPVYYWSGDEGRTLQPMDSTLRSPRFVTEQFEATSRGRHEGSVFRGAAVQPVRAGAHRTLWLWRFPSLGAAVVFLHARADVALAGQCLGGCQHPRRRRARAGLARGRAPREPAGIV
jgi:prolyl oligopeptidase